MYCKRCGTKTESDDLADWARGICTGCAEDEIRSRVDAELEYSEKEEMMFGPDSDKDERFYGLYFRGSTTGETEVLDIHNNLLGSIVQNELGRFYFMCPSETDIELSTWNLLGLAGYLQQYNETW